MPTNSMPVTSHNFPDTSLLTILLSKTIYCERMLVAYVAQDRSALKDEHLSTGATRQSASEIEFCKRSTISCKLVMLITSLLFFVALPIFADTAHISTDFNRSTEKVAYDTRKQEAYTSQDLEIFNLHQDLNTGSIDDFSLVNSHYKCINVDYAYSSFIIGVDDYNRAPFSYTDDGEYKGKYKNILDKFARDCNVKFIYMPLPLEELYNDLFNGIIDFKFPDNPLWMSVMKSDRHVKYSSFIYHYINGLFVKKSSIGKIDLHSAKLGYVNDMLLWQVSAFIDTKNKSFLEKKDCFELIDALNKDELDGFFCDYDVITYALRDGNNNDKITFYTQAPLLDDYYYLSTIKHPNFLNMFNEWVIAHRLYINNILSQ